MQFSTVVWPLYGMQDGLACNARGAITGDGVNRERKGLHCSVNVSAQGRGHSSSLVHTSPDNHVTWIAIV